MEIFVYDDRRELPSYFEDFYIINSQYAAINLITNATEQGSRLNRVNGKIIDLKKNNKLSFARELFDKLYIHLSSNPEGYEKSCFYRWFAYDLSTNNLAESDYLCILDSDQAIFMEPHKILETCTLLNKGKSPELITWLPDNSEASVIEAGPALTIMTKRCLRAFCVYILDEFYSSSNINKLSRYFHESLASKHGSSVSDMTALGHFALAGAFSTFNLKKFFLQSTDFFCCENILYYFTTYYEKELPNPLFNGEFVFNKSVVLFRYKEIEARIIGLHFQGHSKPLMKIFSDPPSRISALEMDKYLKNQTFQQESSNLQYRIALKKRMLTPLHCAANHVIQKLKRQINRRIAKQQ